MRNTILYFCVFCIIYSCSSDDSNSEFIVGEWKVTQRIINGIDSELTVCDPVVIHEFKSDFSMRTFQNGEVSGTVICGIYDFGLYEWEKLTGEHYISNYTNIPYFTTNYYIENNKLRVVFSNGNTAYLTRQ